MKDLFLSEWRRFRRHTFIATLIHALSLLFLSRVTNVLHLGYEDQGMMLVVYMLLGLTLAVVQIGSYRKPSQWLWLIHRPLAPTRIFAALALSALSMLAVAVLAPLSVFVLATDIFTTQVVDSRHYVALVYAMAFTMMAWLAGTLACVSRHKATVMVLIAPVLLAMHLASAWALLLPAFVCLGWLAWIAMQGFRADREAPIARPSVLLLSALPLQLGFFLLVFQLSKVTFEVADLVKTSYPGKTVLTTDPDAEAQMRSMSQDFVIKGLAGSRDPRAAAWRQQLPLLDVAEVMPDIERFPVRHQISNLSARWWDEKRNVEWTFSHDRMMFHGRDPKTGVDRGWWGTAGAGTTQSFAQIPTFGMTANTLYAIDDTTQRQHALVRLPPGERFVGRPVRALNRTLVLTNKRVLAYRSDWRTSSPDSPPLLDWQLATASDNEQPVTVSVVELLDGWLVSLFYYPGPEFDGFERLVAPWQQVVYVGADGETKVVGERRDLGGVQIVLGGSIAVPKTSWWLSPLLYTLGRWPGSVLDKGLTQPPKLAPLPEVRVFYPVAAALMLLSLALGYWWLRGAPISAARRHLWLASCAALSLPAFLSLMCLEPRAPRR
ncbi:hypothetical protein [Lysobacter sp. CFH 32150]|uniref:hypothetical protein n=1 Tax=Lysobacter sp. CFH 32150 TaxID=2927128 RepID=UPI001FA7254F|nr:hypothetical protein [Lysobacter sp. CFH 32150]MCI4568069.1 hypothetical protein [Lysobacter sp. CFH 32150]